jgi:cbb3-type cytochrome oxidase subunit 1
VPRLSRWFIRAALIYLLLGFTFGALLLAHKGVPLHPAMWRLLPAHIEFLVLGWMVQLAMGVAFWILPRFRQPPVRGNVPAAWAAFGLLNAGVLMVGIGSMLGAPALIPFLGRVSEIGAAVAFAVHAWPRVRPPGPCR